MMCTLNNSPIIITGCQRSGTTALAMALHRFYPNITNESDVLKYIVYDDEESLKGTIKSILKTRYNIDCGDMLLPFKGDKKELIKHVHGFINYTMLGENMFLLDSNEKFLTSVLGPYEKNKVSTDIWGDKIVNFSKNIPKIKALFPDCKIVYIVRDGRKVVASSMRLGWGGESTNWQKWITEVKNYLVWKDDVKHLLIRNLSDINLPQRLNRHLDLVLPQDFMPFFVYKASDGEKPEKKETDWKKYITNVPIEAKYLLKEFGYND